MKLTLAQYEVARAKPETNLESIARFAEHTGSMNADLLCLPEMCTTGFDWKFNEGHLGLASSDIEKVAAIARHHSIAICGSFLEKTETGKAANCFYYFDSTGSVRANYRKIHLFTLFHEERHVEAGNDCVDFETKFGHFGASVCYDLRFPELYRRNTASGATLHFVCAAFPHPRLEHWQTLIRARAIENQSYIVATNQCGIEGHGSTVGETKYFGHSMVVDPWGHVVAEADESECSLNVEIDLSMVDQVRSKLSAWEDRREDLY